MQSRGPLLPYFGGFFLSLCFSVGRGGVPFSARVGRGGFLVVSVLFLLFFFGIRGGVAVKGLV